MEEQKADEPRKRRVFLVDDHPLVREWLTQLINRQPDLTVCGEAGDAPRALEAIEKLKPDAAVIDITLGMGSGVELVKDLKHCVPSTAIVVLSMHEESLYAERLLRAGARGYVTKRESAGKVIDAIRSVIDGKLFVSPEFATRMTERLIGGLPVVDSPVAQLTDRELEVFELLGQGFSTRRISEMLNLGIKSVQAYCGRIKDKLNIPTAGELVREAVRWWESRR